MTTTRANGIDGDNIVGHYLHASGWHGFKYDGTDYTIIDVPGGGETRPHGIDGNNIVGEYVGGGGFHRGFLYDGTEYTTLHVPGALSTRAYDIDGSNIAGYYTTLLDSSIFPRHHGFIYDGTEYITFDAPETSGTPTTYIFGIDGSNVVGNSIRNAGGGGFIATIPEPATLSLLMLSGLMFLLRRRSAPAAGPSMTSPTLSIG